MSVVQLASKAIGVSIIGASVLLKVPQILNIVKSRSVRGLSFSMFILELVGYTITLAYSFSNNFAINTYGEYFPIAAQNLVIIFLLYKYTNALGVFFGGATVYAIACYALFSGIIPASVLTLLQTATIPIFTMSKIPQIYINSKNKSVGQLSGITVFLNFAGSLARVFTTLAEVPDNLVLVGYLIGATLNGIMLLQVLIYREGKEKKSS